MQDPTNNRHRFRRFYLRHAVPVTVWLVAVVAVVWLFYQRAERFEMVGMARGQVCQIAASSTCRIREVHVQLFEPVKKGQTLVVVDTILDNEQALEADLNVQLVTAAAEAERLTALLIPTQQQLQADIANREIGREDNQRRFDVDAENARARIGGLKAAIAVDRGTHEDLAVQVKSNEELLKKNLISPFEIERITALRDSTAEKIQENEQLLEQARLDLEQAEQRRQEFSRHELPKQSVDSALEAIRKEIRVQEETMRGLREQLTAVRSRHSVELKSPIDGVVIPIHTQNNEVLHQRPGEQVLRRAEEVVAAGDAILAVSQQEPNEIVAYANEYQLDWLARLTTVEVVKTSPPPKIAASEIRHVGPTIELLPQRLWRNPTIPEWGRPVLIDIPAGLDLVPGEIVGIRGS